MDKYSAEAFPITRASFNLTRACNLACDYCFTNGCTQGSMPWPVAQKAIDFLFEGAQKCKGKDREVEVSFWGGEPLLKWELLQKMVAYATDISKTTSIPVKFGGTTNGTLLTPEKFDFLDKARLKFLVSFDGTPETHNLHRKFRISGEGSHAVIKKNLEAALARWQDYRPRMGLMAERVDHFFEDTKYLFDMGCDHLVFSPVFEGDWTNEKWAIFVEQGKKVVDYMVELLAQGRKVDIQHFKGYIKADASEYPCGAGRFYVGIDIDGAIYPCHRFNKFNDNRPWQEKEMCIGHIDHGITRPEFRSLFIDWDHGCGECPRLKEIPCHGGCYAVRFDMTGSLVAPYKMACKYAEAQQKISAYYKEKVPMADQTTGQSCICNNMCYAEGTDREVKKADPSTDSTCICNYSSFAEDANYTSRPLTLEERKGLSTINRDEKAVLKHIFMDIDRRLKAIENKLGMN